ncbi:MAG: hypothetical protein KKF10_06030 [Verrucomicrobia bacterium]|nr:hypothetical protein [Verrucomicrobiota bacterium]
MRAKSAEKKHEWNVPKARLPDIDPIFLPKEFGANLEAAVHYPGLGNTKDIDPRRYSESKYAADIFAAQ